MQCGHIPVLLCTTCLSYTDGAAYALGRINGDAWYLYTVCVPQLVEGNDQTLEVLSHYT